MSVAYIIREHYDELEADLLEFFGIDLSDVWCRQLSIRRLAILIKSLMQKGGRSTLLMVLDERGMWDTTDYMLAHLYDQLSMSHFLFMKANVADEAASKEIPNPDPFPRPGDDEDEDIEPDKPELEMASGEELATFFQQMTDL